MPLPWRPNTTLCLCLPEAEDFGFESFGKRIRETEKPRERRESDSQSVEWARAFFRLWVACARKEGLGRGVRRAVG